VKNYTVKFVGTEKEKVIPYRFSTIIFNQKNEKVVDLVKLLDSDKRFKKNSREYNKFLKKMYIFLLEKGDCIPYLSIDSAINAVIDTRDDGLMSKASKIYKDKIKKLSISILTRKSELLNKHVKEVDKLTDDLNASVNKSFQAMEVDKKHQAEALNELRNLQKSEEHITEQERKRLQDNLNSFQELLIKSQSKHFNAEVKLKSAIAKLKLEQAEELKAVDVEVSAKIDDVKKEQTKVIDTLFYKLSERHEGEKKDIKDIVTVKKSKKSSSE